MQILFHIGAHCTGHDTLVRSLLKNRDMLAHAGVAVPGPGRYRRTLGEVLVKLRGARATPETQELLLDTLLDDDDSHRLILSNESFLCMASRVLDGGRLYRKIDKSAWLRNAFPGAQVEFAVSLRNLATFLPALYEKLGGEAAEDRNFLQGAKPDMLSWFNVIDDLRKANPGSKILIWCYEDAPILWPEIMRGLSTLPPETRLEGANDLARKVLTPEGSRAMRAYLNETRPETEMERREIVADFLAGFAEEDEMEQEITLPGWTEEIMDRLTEAYDRDVERIAELPNVRMMLP